MPFMLMVRVFCMQKLYGPTYTTNPTECSSSAHQVYPLSVQQVPAECLPSATKYTVWKRSSKLVISRVHSTALGLALGCTRWHWWCSVNNDPIKRNE